jgi:hypothetical protein
MQIWIENKLKLILKDLEHSIKKAFPDDTERLRVNTHIAINLFGNLILGKMKELPVRQKTEGCGLALNFMADWFAKFLSHLHKETEMN